MAKPAVAGETDHLPPGKGGLGPDGLRQGVGHRAVNERTQQAALAVHVQIASGPDRGRAHVAGEDRVLSGELIQYLGDVLRVDGRASGLSHGQVIQPLRAFW